MEQMISLKALVASFLYSLIGLGIFALGFWGFDRITPGKFWHEIIEEHNTALAILVGAVAIGISTIIAAAIHG